jgi:hypothetical protein
VGGQLTKFSNVGTFDPMALRSPRVGTTIVEANGSLGFNTPSLLSVFAGRRISTAAVRRRSTTS